MVHIKIGEIYVTFGLYIANNKGEKAYLGDNVRFNSNNIIGRISKINIDEKKIVITDGIGEYTIEDSDIIDFNLIR